MWEKEAWTRASQLVKEKQIKDSVLQIELYFAVLFGISEENMEAFLPQPGEEISYAVADYIRRGLEADMPMGKVMEMKQMEPEEARRQLYGFYYQDVQEKLEEALSKKIELQEKLEEALLRKAELEEEVTKLQQKLEVKGKTEQVPWKQKLFGRDHKKERFLHLLLSGKLDANQIEQLVWGLQQKIPVEVLFQVAKPGYEFLKIRQILNAYLAFEKKNGGKEDEEPMESDL